MIPINMSTFKTTAFLSCLIVSDGLTSAHENNTNSTSQASQGSLVAITSNLPRGTLFGAPFQAKKVKFSQGTLKIAGDDKFIPDRQISIMFLGGQNTNFAGKTIRITKKSGFKSPSVRMVSEIENRHISKSTQRGYSMVLKFGRWRPDGTALAKISLAVPEHDTRLSGEFEIVRPFNPQAALAKHHRPYVAGTILIPRVREPHLRAGFFGESQDGLRHSNMAGMKFNAKPGFAASTTFEPQVTAVLRSRKLDFQFKHVKLAPGRYFFFVILNKTIAVGEWVDVHPDAEVTLSTTIPKSETGQLEIHVPNAKDNGRVYFVPLELVDDEAKALSYARSLGLSRKVSDERITIDGLPVGRYRIEFHGRSLDVMVDGNRTKRVVLEQAEGTAGW